MGIPHGPVMGFPWVDSATPEDSHCSLTSMGWRNTPSCNAWDKAGLFPRAVSGLNKKKLEFWWLTFKGDGGRESICCIYVHICCFFLYEK